MRKKKKTDDRQNADLSGIYGRNAYEEAEKKPLYHGRYEKDPSEYDMSSDTPVYHGRYEKTDDEYEASPVRETMSSYQGRYASDADTSYKTDSVEEYEDFYRAKHEAGTLRPAVEIEAQRNSEEDNAASAVIERILKRADEKVREERRRKSERHAGKKDTKRKRTSGKKGHDTLIKSGSLILSLVLMLAMILNMPILLYKKSGQPDERVSIVKYLKKWQPTVDIEGELQQNSMDLKIKTDVVESDFTDGLDLPQLVEGQYSVLFVGFDETEQLTDVVWVCQFDIGSGMLNILQIPRDLAVPDYTNSPTCKFNSIYTEGDYYVKPPIQRVVNAVQENFGIPIDAYITTACFDIADMVDLVGGIPMHVDNEIMYEADKIIPEGDVTLSGDQAEWFVRFRREWAEGDIGRMQNQRKFMAAAMQKLLSIVKDDGRIKLYGYLNEIYKNQWIATNMSLEDLSKLADFASTLSLDSVRVNMVPGEGANYIAEDGMEYSFYSVHKYATVTMLNQYYRPYQDKLKTSDVALVEYVEDYNNRAYDDTSETLNEVETADEPKRIG